MQTSIKLTEGITLGFQWAGGAYIEVCVGTAFGSPKEVINVWDYVEGQPIIPKTREGLRSAAHQWIAGYGKAELIHDVTENWPHA